MERIRNGQGLVRPHIQAQKFELKPVLFQLLQIVGSFSGLPMLFPYSLRDRARAWLNALLSGFQHWMQMEMFYNGLNAYTRMLVDTSANGIIIDKSYNEDYEILERIAYNDYQCPTTRVGTDRRVAGGMELDAITSLIAQNAASVPPGTQLLGIVNETITKEGISTFANEKNSELVGEQATKEKSNQKNAEVDGTCIVDKNATTKQFSEMEGRPPSPFPQQFQKSKQDVQFKKFLEVLKQLHINIPFVESLKKMLKYVKFMKDILSKKRRLGEFETVALTEVCTTMLINKLAPKLKDLWSFTIPCSIGNLYVGKTLFDLDASINLMPMSIFRKLGIRKVRPTTITL
ncbi:UPF0746 protein [Gossypium australe]|uniref:UPF0746 protein n=1 Tax=Gossypium australe TaxID=47621 RepID=A0A5B6WA83_9ROSI|nr:UPF0746 protein [Gossypium australe]